MKKKNIDLYKNVKKNLEHFIEAHSYDIDKPKEEAKQDIRAFIEKMAVWFELRYPDSEIKRMFGSYNTEIDITTEIFYNNLNLADILKNSMTEIDLKWHDFYNYDAFYRSLSEQEKRFIKEPCYPDMVYLYSKGPDHVHLSPEGYVEIYEFSFYNNLVYSIIDKDEKCHIEKFIKILEEKGKPIDSNSEVYKAINLYDNQNRLRNNIIECVMYRIMMRGDRKESSLRRSYLFAKEFCPMEIDFLADYAVVYQDLELLKSMRDDLGSAKIEDIMQNKILQKYIKLVNL